MTKGIITWKIEVDTREDHVRYIPLEDDGKGFARQAILIIPRKLTETDRHHILKALKRLLPNMSEEPLKRTPHYKEPL